MKKSFIEIHLAVLMWGLTGILGKLISLDAPVLVWYRMGLTALIIAVSLYVKKDWQKMEQKDVRRARSIGVLFAFHWIAFYAAIKLANASIAMICLSTAGIFVALFDPIINKTSLNLKDVALGALAIIGMVLIYALPASNDSIPVPMKNFNLGLVLGIIAALISTAFTILNKPIAVKYKAQNLVFHEMMSGWVFISLLLPIYYYFYPNTQLLPSGMDYIWLLILVYFCTVLAQSLSISALKNLSPFTVAFSVNLEPVYGIILAFVFFKENEQLGLGFYLGMALITISVLLQVILVINKNKLTKIEEKNRLKSNL